MSETSWILIGMMGAGKTSVGRELAKVSGREFQDTDRLLEYRLGRPVSGIFHTYGEPTFRQHETSILESLHPGRFVVSTGGGIVTVEANWAEMDRLGTTIFLRVTPERLIERLKVSRKRRPLLETDNWEDRLRDLYQARMPLYERADIIFDVPGNHSDEIAAKLYKVLQP